MPFVVYVESGVSWSFDTWDEVALMIVNHEVPYDPEDDDDVRLYLSEVTQQEGRDLEFGRAHMREACEAVEAILSKAHASSSWPVQVRSFTIARIKP